MRTGSGSGWGRETPGKVAMRWFIGDFPRGEIYIYLLLGFLSCVDDTPPPKNGGFFFFVWFLGVEFERVAARGELIKISQRGFL